MRQTEIVRMSHPVGSRKQPSAQGKRSILAEQGNMCLYCDRAFGSWAQIGARTCQVQLRWDHMKPHAYDQDNRDENFAAACQFCNSWKSDKMFLTVQEVRDFVQAIWAKKAVSEV